jgi:hypothetical protein
MSAPPPVDERSEALAAAKQVAAGTDGIRIPQDLVTERETASSATSEPDKALWLRIRTMTVGQKVKLAFNGNKDVRTILLRDSNKIIPRLVLQNPRITEEEILMLAKDRNADDEILRRIAETREWTRVYAVRAALVENARTPLPRARMLLQTLGEHEIARLAKSKSVSNAIAVQARRLLMQSQDRRK